MGPISRTTGLTPVLDEAVMLNLPFRRHVLGFGSVVVTVTIDVIGKLGRRDRELGGLRQCGHGRTIVGGFGKERVDIGAFVRHIVP